MREHLNELTACMDGEQRRALFLLACERRVTAGMLARLNLIGDIPGWLSNWVAHGLLVDAGVVHGLGYTRNVSGARAVAIAPGYRPLVLRDLAERGALEQTRQDAQIAVGHSAVAGLMTALYSGDLTRLRTELSEMRSRSGSEFGEKGAVARSRLWEAVCSPFEPDTLIRTWGDDAWLLVEQVLSDASVTLDAVGDVYQWALCQSQECCNPRTLRILLEQAILRGDLAAMHALLARLPHSEALTAHAVEAFLRGDMAGAQQLLDDVDAAKQKQTRALPCPTSVTALLTLLALSGNRSAGAALARRVLPRVSVADPSPIPGWPAVDSQLALVRALRVLMRFLTRPEPEFRRLSPHHLGADTPGWQTMTTALAVLVQDCDATTRMAWARRLLDDATRWNQGGYDWFALQSRHLAKALSVEAIADFESLAPCRAGEPLLSLLLEREPEWRIALRAVDNLLKTVEREDTTLSRRVAWFLDMSSGELAKPALEEYRSGMGWTQARRVDMKELRALKDSLPAEDAAVLIASESHPPGGLSAPEAIEALCGHPRVFNGARGRQRVEVVRGACRVQTERDRGHLVIRVEPAGASEGVHVVVESEARVVVYRVNAAFAKLLKLIPHGIRIPEGHQDQGRALLARLAEHVQVQSPELGACRVASADSTPCLRISPEAGAWWVEIGVRPFGEFGRFFPPGLGRSVVTVHADDELFDTERSLEQEIARYHALLVSCPTLASATRVEGDFGIQGGDPYGFSLGADDLYSLLSELRESGHACNLEWQNCRAIRQRGKLTAASLHGSLRRIKGWYLVHGSIALDDACRMDLSELVRMPFTKSGRFIRLPSGDYLEVERRIAQVLSQLGRVAQLPVRGTPGELKIPETAIESLRSLIEVGSSLEIDPSISDWSARVTTALATNAPLPHELRATLRSYQLDGFRWLYRYSQLGFGVCLADDMGLGKTVQVIALLLTRATGGAALVVAPTSVCTNWIEELRRFAPSLEVAEYAGRHRVKLLDRVRSQDGESRLHVLVTSYALLQQDAVDLAAVQWHTAVLDEAQFIKNPNSLRAKAAFRLVSRHRIAMTGTPVENHLGDLWSIFHFLNPSLLGSFRHFQLSYLRPIEREHSAEQRALLKTLTRPFLLRRRKDEVLQELPPITTLRHEVRLSEDETLRYTLLRRQIHEKLGTPHGKRQHKLQILAEITRLRRFCCHPRLVFPDAPTESSKLQAFLELVEELRDNGHRALVFSQFVDFLELVRSQLDERAFRYVYLDGSTPKEARSERVRAFQTGDAELFLISLKAGGFGLNLTAADYVIHLDPWWNPAVEAQATDRAHRIGQERPVTVYRLVTKDSIEERIIALHEEKRALAEALLDGGEGTQNLGADELLALLETA